MSSISLELCATDSEEGLMCFPTVKSKVTQGVIICDVRTDMASYHTHTPIHIATFMHSHMVPGAHMCDSHYTQVCVCLLSYGKGSTLKPWVE